MTKEALIMVCGFYSLGFVLFHLLFWRIFNWKETLLKSTTANRAIIQIANLRLIHVFGLCAYLCFVYPTELYQTALGRTFLAGMSLFWLGRTIEQFVFLRHNNLFVHTLTLIFMLGTLLFLLPLIVD